MTEMCGQKENAIVCYKSQRTLLLQILKSCFLFSFFSQRTSSTHSVICIFTNTGNMQMQIFFLFCFLRQGFSVTLEPVLETGSCRPGRPQTHRDPPAFASCTGIKGVCHHCLAANANYHTDYSYLFPAQGDSIHRMALTTPTCSFGSK